MTVPRYQKVYETLQQRIAAGQYPIGSLLPTEQDLCGEFGVSRYTVREALRRLTEGGMLARRQGSGSEVLSKERSNNYVQTMRSLGELFEYASETFLEIDDMAMVVADETLSARLGRVAGREWLRVNAVRRSKTGEGICFSQIYLHSDYKDAAGALPTLKGPFYRHLEEHYQVEIIEVIQTISAEPFSQRGARAIGVAPGTVAIMVERRYLGRGDVPILVSFNWHPSETFTYSMSLKREDPPR